MARAAIVLAICAALAAIATAQTTAPGVACFSYSSKYRYCFAVMASDATAKTSCAAKDPMGKPDTFATQTQCCKEKFGGTCGFSGGPSGRTCWMPDTATKKCKLVDAAAMAKGASCDHPLGAFQSEAVCLAESFAAAAAGGATTLPAAGGATTRPAAGGATTLPAAGGSKAATTPTAPKTAPGVACFSYSSKYRYCFAVMASDATAKATCAAKNPMGKPDTWPTQTQCCKEAFGGSCGYSGGPSGGPAGATCWMPVAGTKKCKKLTREEASNGGCSNDVGGFQLEAVCVAESF